MRLQYSLFASEFDSDGKLQFDDFCKLVKSPIVKDDHQHPLIRFFHQNTNRSPLQNQLYTAVILDLDAQKPRTLQKVKEALDLLDVNVFLHTTRSHTSQEECFRVIFPLRYPIDFSCQQKYRTWLEHKLQVKSDSKCNEPTRGYYIPKQTDTYEHYEIIDADLLDEMLFDIQEQELPLLHKAVKEKKNISTREGGDEPVKLRVSASVSTLPIDSYQSLVESWSDRVTQLRILKAVGYLPETIGFKDNGASTSFRSPLWSHDDQKPSWTCLWDATQEKFLFYSHASGTTLDAIDLYFQNSTRSHDIVRGPSRAVWLTRLLVEAGVIVTPEIHAESVPEDVAPSVKRTWEAIINLFKVKWTLSEEPSVLSVKFVSKWASVSVGAVSAAIRYLKENGFLVQCDYFESKHSMRMATWIPKLV